VVANAPASASSRATAEHLPRARNIDSPPRFAPRRSSHGRRRLSLPAADSRPNAPQTAPAWVQLPGSLATSLRERAAEAGAPRDALLVQHLDTPAGEPDAAALLLRAQHAVHRRA